MKSKKAMELPVNIVVTVIIGLVIFGLGMGLFSKISKGSEEQIVDLQNKVQTGLSSLECDGDDICIPTIKVRNGKQALNGLQVLNIEENDNFKIKVNNLVDEKGTLYDDSTIGGYQFLSKDECGMVKIDYYQNELTIPANEGAEFPISVMASRVSNTPCSFTTTISIFKGNEEYDKTSLVISVE